MNTVEATAIEAKVVNDSNLFDDPLFSTLKELTVEELLTKSIEIIDGLNMKTLTTTDFNEVSLIKLKIKGNLQQLLLLFGEVVRRGVDVSGYCVNQIHTINTFVEEDKCQICGETKYIDYYLPNQVEELFGKYSLYSNLFCSSCKVKHSAGFNPTLLSSTKDYLGMRQIHMHNSISSTNNNIRLRFDNKLRCMKMIKETMIKILKTPLLTKELEACMDEILDLNGNKISQMKEYLTEEQYRFVRSGARFEDLPKQQELLDSFNEMLKDLKRRVIVEASSEPIKFLEKELMTHKTRQKQHEKDLEKLKCKI